MGVSLGSLRSRIKERSVVEAIRSGRFAGKAYLVGGAVRELCLGREPNDFDIVLSRQEDLGTLEELLGSCAFALGKKPIQTCRIVKKDLSVDITFLSSSIEDDLARRDFTMNAVAYDIHGDEIIDVLGGIEDIEKRMIRCPSKGALLDDPLRMLKAIRHFSVIKGFVIQDDLEQSIGELKTLINRPAPERIKYEMDQVLIAENSFDGLKLMEKTGLLFQIFPELEALQKMDLEKKFTLGTYGHTIDGFKFLRTYGELYDLDEKDLKDVGYALLFHDFGKAHTFSYDEQKRLVHFFYHERVSNEIASLVMERLRFSSHEISTIHKLIENHMRIFLVSNADSTEKALKRLVYKIEGLTPSLIVHTMCDMYGSSGGQENSSTERVKKKCDELMECYSDWKKKPLPRVVDGYDLINLGFKEGPQLGQVLAEIRERQISGEITERDEAIRYATSLLS